MSGVSDTRGNYTTKFTAGVVAVLVAVAAAALNVYTDMAAQLPASLQSELVSGIVTILLVLTVGIVFVGASVGREALSALRVVATRARRLEDGELDADLEPNRNDEFGEVYRALAALRSGIEDRRERLAAAEERDQRIERYAAEWSAQMDAVASGDFSQRLDEDIDDPDLAKLAARFNRMMDSIEGRER